MRDEVMEDDVAKEAISQEGTLQLSPAMGHSNIPNVRCNEIF